MSSFESFSKQTFWLCFLLAAGLFAIGNPSFVSRVDAFPAILSDDQQLSLPATGPDIHFGRIRTLALGDGVAQDILSQPIQFPKLIDIGLNSEENNSRYVDDLVVNYPGLKGLAIHQHHAIAESDISKIKKLMELKTLYFDCPIDEELTMNFTCLTKLKELRFGPLSNVSQSQKQRSLVLPTVKKLMLAGVKIDTIFLQSVKAPCLEDIELLSDTVEPHALDLLESFPTLKRIHLLRTPIRDEELLRLRSQFPRKSGEYQYSR
ncbi:MAG: hypothetical protein P4L53_18805 [Candidatus Obscuribacterales bacterium]|nr:hypothetical protein [Candidatus Obscuribacterales bacterium]